MLTLLVQRIAPPAKDVNCRPAPPVTIYSPSSLPQDPHGLEKEDQHDHRDDIPDHEPEEALEAEPSPAVLHFLDDPVRTYDPADQDRGEEGDKGHEEAVADVIHDVEDLPDAPVRQRDFHIEETVPQGDDDGGCGIDSGQDQGRTSAAGMQDLHAVGGDGLQDRDAACKGGKTGHEEKESAHDAPDPGHGGKHLGQGDKHQTGPAFMPSMPSKA